MARYINEKDVYKLVEPSGTVRVHCAQIDELSRADVVPKSEIENIFAEIELEIKEALNSNYEARRIRLNNKHEKREIPACYCGDEFICICDGKITALRGIEYFLAELKKKYTEGE